jgi:hypothetical protein
VVTVALPLPEAVATKVTVPESVNVLGFASGTPKECFTILVTVTVPAMVTSLTVEPPVRAARL